MAKHDVDGVVVHPNGPWGNRVPVPHAEVKLIDEDRFTSDDELLVTTTDALGRFVGRTREWLDHPLDYAWFAYEVRKDEHATARTRIDKLGRGLRLEVPWAPSEVTLDRASFDAASGLLRAMHTGGLSGIYLERVDYGVIHACNERVGYDPSSSIKAAVYAMVFRAIEASAGAPGAVDLNTAIIPVVPDPAFCPFDSSEPGTVFPMTIAQAMQLMIMPSSNIATEVLRQMVRPSTLNQMIRDLGMVDTAYRGPVGCTRNQTTLADMARLYRAMAVTPGFLNAMRPHVFMLHNWGPIQEIDATVRAKATALGMATAGIEGNYRKRILNIYKMGQGSTSAPDDLSDMSMTGYIGLPFVTGGTIEMRHYLYGVFIDIADNITAGSNLNTVVAAMLKSEVEASISSFGVAGLSP